MARKAKIPFKNISTGVKFYRWGSFCEMKTKLTDITGEAWTVYMRGTINHLAGIRVNDPQVGFIVKGYFHKIGTLETLLHREEWLLDRVEECSVLAGHKTTVLGDMLSPTRYKQLGSKQ